MSEHDHPIRRHLEFHYGRGSWAIRGLPNDTGSRFDDLTEAMDYAKAECAAEPACIEMIVGDFHMIAFQEPGWSRRLCYQVRSTPPLRRYGMPIAQET